MSADEVRARVIGEGLEYVCRILSINPTIGVLRNSCKGKFKKTSEDILVLYSSR